MTRSTLTLYRTILRAAQVWPSTRRAKVIEEIRAGAPRMLCCADGSAGCRARSALTARSARAEFRENRHVREPEKVAEFLRQAEAGLAALQSQGSQLGKGTGQDISYTFEAGSRGPGS